MPNRSLVAVPVMLLLAGSRLLAQYSDVPQAQGAQAAQAAQAAPAAQGVTSSQGAEAAPARSGRPQEQNAGSSPGVGVALRNGDTVEIRIANVPPEDVGQIDGTYTLDESGMLNLPFIGLVKAGGLPPSQVQIAIQNKYIADGIYTNPTVTVNPPAGARFISVSGAVRAPGRVPYSSDLTLLTTIDSAGGPSDFAGDKIRLVRGGKVQFFSRKKLNKDPSLDIRIEPGDQIEIVESWW